MAKQSNLERITQKILDTGRTVQEVFSDFEEPCWSESYFKKAQQFLESVYKNFQNLPDKEKKVFLSDLVKRTEFPFVISPFYTQEGEKSLTPAGYTPIMGDHLTHLGENWVGSLRSLTSVRTTVDGYKCLIKRGVEGEDITPVIKLIDFLPMAGEFVSKKDLRKNLSKYNLKFEIISQVCLPFIPAEYVSHMTTASCYGYREIDEFKKLREKHPKVEINAHGGSQDVYRHQWGSTCSQSDYHCFVDFFRVDFDSLFGVKGLNELTYKLTKETEE